MREVGGFGFVKPVDRFAIKSFINIFDSKNGRFVLRTQNSAGSDFYQITCATSYGTASSYGGSDTVISQNALDLSRGGTWDTFVKFDLSKTYIPIFFITSSHSGALTGAEPLIAEGHMSLKPNDGIETNQDYLVFYLQVHKPK